MNIFYQLKYFFGTIYRGLIGRYHNAFDKVPEINKEVENFVIGKSVGEKEIKVYRISGKNMGSLTPSGVRDDIALKKMLFVAGIHGNEVGTVKLAQHIINYFYDIFCRGEKFFAHTIYVIPCLNPDGYEISLKNPDYAHRGNVGRFNKNGVDLNRNFPTKNWQSRSDWGFGTNYNDKHFEVFCGASAGSEQETQTLITFIKQENIENLIMLHNAGKDVIYNQGDEVAKNWAEIYNKFSKFKIRTDLGYSGSVAEWAMENNVHYLTVEGSSRWGSDWRRQKKAIEEILQEM